MNCVYMRYSAARMMVGTLLLVAFAAPALLLGQQTPAPPLQSEPAVPPRLGVSSDNPLTLSLEQVIEMALANSNDLAVSRFDTEIAALDVVAAQGAYDPLLASFNFYDRQVVPVTSLIGGGANGKLTQASASGNIGTRGLTPWGGGRFEADLRSSRVTSDNLFTTFSPQYSSSLQGRYTQPLLRGFRFDQPRRQIAIARRRTDLSDADLRLRATEVITAAEQTYWTLAFARRNLEVQAQAVQQARAQVESNRRQVEQGVLAAIDVVEAETQAAVFEQEVYRAQEALTRAENALKLLILPGRESTSWSRPISPATSLRADLPPVTLEEAVRQALARRPETARLEAAAAIIDVNERFFKDQTRPQADLIGTYTLGGLAGELVARNSNPLTAGNAVLQERVNLLSQLSGLSALPEPPPLGSVPEGLTGSLGQSLRNLFEGRYPSARIDLQLSLPIRNRTAEANLARTLLERAQIERQRAQLTQFIEADVRNALQSMESVRARVAAAAVARRSAQEQYESEQRRFQAGLSTVFLVSQRQTAFVAAQARELQAETDLRNAIAAFHRAAGGTLERWNVILARPPQ